MPDLPKYIGIEGSHTDFEDREVFALGEYCTFVHGNEASAVSAKLNAQFAQLNVNWDTGVNNEYPHISDLYVRTRDVMPLLKLARSLADKAVFGSDTVGDELVRCLDYLKDLE